MPLPFLWIQLEQPQQKMEFVPTPLRHTSHGSLRDFWSTSSPSPDIKTLVLPMFTRSPFHSMLVFQRISFCLIAPAVQSWWPGHLHTGFPSDILYETHVKWLLGTWATVSKSLGKRPLSHCTLHSGCNQHALCFWPFHTYIAPATHQCLACEETTRLHVWYTIECLLQNQAEG